MTDPLADLTYFARLHIASGDIDPAYPVLRRLLDPADPQRAWKILVYVGHYNLASAITAWDFHPEPFPESQPYQGNLLPCGTERRGLRGGLVERHLRSIVSRADGYGSVDAWLQAGWETTTDPHERWRITAANVQDCWNNGRWAAYKTCELLATVLDWPMSAPDAGHAWSSGPRKGLALLYGAMEGNSPVVITALDKQTLRVLDHLAACSITTDLAQVETVLCDFHSLAGGSYYVGHDIDQQWEQAILANAAGYLSDDNLLRLEIARHASFLPRHRERVAVDKPRRRAYVDAGLILAPEAKWTP